MFCLVEDEIIKYRSFTSFERIEVFDLPLVFLTFRVQQEEKVVNALPPMLSLPEERSPKHKKPPEQNHKPSK